MTAQEALKICPSIALAHVETLGEGGSSDGGSVVFGGGGAGNRGGNAAPSSSSSSSAAAAAQQQQFVPRKSDRKASLLRYRDASARVLLALKSFFPPGTVVEKASIDEFYVDATAAVEAMLRPENGGCPVGVCEAAARARGGVVVEGFQDDDYEKKEGGEGEEEDNNNKASSSSSPLSLDPTNPLDARLAAGAALASGARALILSETGYTLSAGISHNKLLSKVASAKFKPDRQAVVPRRGAPLLLRSLPLSRLPGFGGKLGAAIAEATGAETAGDVAALPLEAVKAALGGDGDAALGVFHAARGESRSRVVEKAAPKSLMAAKSLDAATSSRALLERWLSILAEELAARLGADGRPPRTLALHCRCRGAAAERSVSGPAPRAMRRSVAVPPDAGAIAAAAGALLTRAMAAAAAAAVAAKASGSSGGGGGGSGSGGISWPSCSRLSLVAGDFAPPRATGAASIASFFAVSPAKKRKEEEEEVEEGKDRGGGELMPPPPPLPVCAPATATATLSSSRPGPQQQKEEDKEDPLSTVDVREQERILREIERGRAGAGGGTGGGSGCGGGKGRSGKGKGAKRDAPAAPPARAPDSKQRSIAAMFGRGESGGGK